MGRLVAGGGPLSASLQPLASGLSRPKADVHLDALIVGMSFFN